MPTSSRDDGEATYDVLCCDNDWDECNRPNGSFKCSGNNSSGGADGTSAPRNERKRNNEMALASDDVKTSSDVDNVCMECNVIPTNHMCLKCNVVPVCACCCDENCGLRNNIW